MFGTHGVFYFAICLIFLHIPREAHCREYMCIFDLQTSYKKKNLGPEFENIGIKILEKKNQGNKLMRKESVGFLLIFS